jgi:hypothetical protein
MGSGLPSAIGAGCVLVGGDIAVSKKKKKQIVEYKKDK